MQPEKKFEHEITDYCDILGIDYLINQQQKKCKCGRWASIGSTKGVPDMCVFLNGETIWIELKTETGKFSKDQIEFRQKLLDNKIIVYAARSLEEFKRIIDVYTKIGVEI